MTDKAMIRAALEALGVLTEGASERCEFVEITNEAGRLFTVDLTGASEMSAADYQSFLDAVAAHMRNS